jgi:phosphate transport system protein
MLNSKISELKRLLMREAAYVEKMVTNAVDALYQPHENLLQEVLCCEEKVNAIEVDLETRCVAAIALFQPEAKDLRRILMILKINNDLERLGDQAVNIAESAEHLAGQPIPSILPELRSMRDAACKMLRDSLDAFTAEDVDASRMVCDSDQLVDDLNRAIYHRLVDHLKSCPAHPETFLHLLRVAKNIERIGDLSTNIAENTVYMAIGKVIKHNKADT